MKGIVLAAPSVAGFLLAERRGNYSRSSIRIGRWRMRLPVAL